MNRLRRTFKSLADKPLPEDRRIIDPGRYCLERDLLVDDNIGILINCSDVRLDLNGHTISHRGGAAPQSFGILGSGHHSLTIVNGCVDGFWHGVHLINTFDSRICDLTIRNTGYVGIYLTGSEIQISDNVVEEPRMDLSRTVDKYVVGLHLGGADLTVARNSLSMTPNRPAPDVEYVGILVSTQTTATDIHSNSIHLSAYLPKSYGVWIADQCQVLVAENDISNVQFAVVSDSKDAEVIENILHNDGLHPDTQGVHIPKSEDSSLIAGNTIEGFEYPTVLKLNEES